MDIINNSHFLTGITPSSSSRTRTPASINATPANINLAGGALGPGSTEGLEPKELSLTCHPHLYVLTDLTRAVNALPQNMTSQMFSAIAAVTGQGQNPNATPAQWASSQYGYGGSGGGSSAYHVRGLGRMYPHGVGSSNREQTSFTNPSPVDTSGHAHHKGLHKQRWLP